jgi:hypothetical protein
MTSKLNISILNRGIRNNNPGNLIRTSNQWQGKIPYSSSKDAKFEQFTYMEYGVRAMLLDLINDINKGKNTVRKLINEYAPAFENNTMAYINSVATSLNVTPDFPLKVINSDFLLLLAKAIIKVENGKDASHVTDEIIKTAISMVGNKKLSNIEIKNTVKTGNFPYVLELAVFFYSAVTFLL